VDFVRPPAVFDWNDLEAVRNTFDTRNATPTEICLRLRPQRRSRHIVISAIGAILAVGFTMRFQYDQIAQAPDVAQLILGPAMEDVWPMLIGFAFLLFAVLPRVLLPTFELILHPGESTTILRGMGFEQQRLAGVADPMIVRPSKGVHIVVPRDRIESEYALILPTEKSVLFVLPWGEHWIIGTTDTDWNLDKAHPAATRADIDYLLKEVNTAFQMYVQDYDERFPLAASATAPPVATRTPANARTAATPLAGRAIVPLSSVTTTAARFERATLSTNEVFRPWAKTATKTTSARPIIRAEAVAAVRRGSRAAFSRAIRPLVGASACSGRPMSVARGRTR